ncbi:hypothetical protein M8818_004332 [Zalaria obscura]|uniref:Uncharacterized protein n=1 Tax=Zalaria obscura TaxID=2024903 RepID=A0ACC3SAS9_9PEZI
MQPGHDSAESAEESQQPSHGVHWGSKPREHRGGHGLAAGADEQRRLRDQTPQQTIYETNPKSTARTRKGNLGSMTEPRPPKTRPAQAAEPTSGHVVDRSSQSHAQDDGPFRCAWKGCTAFYYTRGSLRAHARSSGHSDIDPMHRFYALSNGDFRCGWKGCKDSWVKA